MDTRDNSAAFCNQRTKQPHHWLIDDHGVGRCKHCRRKRTFALTIDIGTEFSIRPAPLPQVYRETVDEGYD